MSAVLAANVATLGGIVTAVTAAVGGLIVAYTNWREGRSKPAEHWVTMVERSLTMADERMERVEADEAQCQKRLTNALERLGRVEELERKGRRNIAKMRAAMVAGGLPVPQLED